MRTTNPSASPMTDTAVAETNDILAQMTSKVMDRKSPVPLTPTKAERVATPDPLDQGQAFPWDRPTDVVAGVIKVIERELAIMDGELLASRLVIQGQLTYLRQYIDLPVETDRNTVKKPDKTDRPMMRDGVLLIQDPVISKAVTAPANAGVKFIDEAELLRQFEASMAAKASDAQAQAFGPAWKCDQHGKFIVKVSKLNREYRACPDCNEFQHLA
jgi:hypothetical protein